MEISILESKHDLKNFTNPHRRNFMKFYQTFNAGKVVYQTNRISLIKTTTTQGTFSRVNKTEEGFFYFTQTDTFQDRTPDNYIIWIYEGLPGAPERFQYGMIQLEISDRKIEVLRIYPSVINVFQRIGGVCQIFIFVFVYIMIYSNEIVIELYLLNYGVLMLPPDSQEG